MELRRHGDNHVIEVGVEVTTFRDIVTERSIVVVASQQVVGVVVETRLVSGSLGELRGPHTLVGLLGLMDGHVWGPDAVIDLALTEVPLLEVVTAVLLMSRVDLGEEDHLLLELALGETLVDEQVVLLMHGTVAALARAGEDLEAATEGGGVEGVPGDLRGPVGVTVVHTDGVYLFFVTLDTVGGTNVVTEDPSLRSVAGARE